jgi:hypothetical protein
MLGLHVASRRSWSGWRRSRAGTGHLLELERFLNELDGASDTASPVALLEGQEVVERRFEDAVSGKTSRTSSCGLRFAAQRWGRGRGVRRLPLHGGAPALLLRDVHELVRKRGKSPGTRSIAA